MRNRIYSCFSCGADPIIRVFCGSYAGGWCACARHQNDAIQIALTAMVSRRMSRIARVSCYQVHEDLDGYPYIARCPMWTATRKAQKPDASTEV